MLFGILWMLWGCTPPSVQLAKRPAADAIQVEDAWARSVPPNATNSAVYLHLRNQSSKERELVAARSKAARRVELHATKDENGMLRMERLSAILIPSLGIQDLHPGGMHIMLIGLKNPLQLGSQIELELTYSDQSKQTLKVPVEERPLQAPASNKHDHTQHQHSTSTGKP